MAVILAVVIATAVTVEAKGVGLHTLEALINTLILKPIIRGLLIALPTGVWLASGGGASFSQNFDKVILYNPPVESIYPFMNMLLKIMFPIYALLIVSAGFYLLLCSSSPQGRANAKTLLGKLLVTLVAVSISPKLMQVIFFFSGSLTENIFSLSSLELIKGILTNGIWGMLIMATWLMIPDVELAAIPYMLVHVFAWFPYIIISLRNIVLTALMMLFPAGVLFYFLPGLRSIGKTIIEQFMIWTFIQAFTALALVSVAKAYRVTTLVSNPKLTCLNICPIPGCNNLLSFLFISIDIGTTDLASIGFGTVAYVVVILSPIIMIMLFNKFLPD